MVLIRPDSKPVLTRLARYCSLLPIYDPLAPYPIFYSINNRPCSGLRLAAAPRQ